MEVSTGEGRDVPKTPKGERRYQITPVGVSAQELWITGGLEGLVKRSIEVVS